MAVWPSGGEKFVPKGGPSGGDGGRGGDVVLVASQHHNTLLHFRFNPEYTAERGRHGEGSQRTGRNGHDIEAPVPVGTLVYDTGNRRPDARFHGPRRPFHHRQGPVAAGAATNTSPPPSTRRRRTTNRAVRGTKSACRLELKLLADVGLVGFPNAGKSTLISRISAARPKIADYPFTTLEPNLGVVQADGMRTFVVADIPGLIEGAHEGHGLGIQFLKHVERTRLLVHLVDVSEMTGREPKHDFDVILNELASFSSLLAAKPMFVVASKMDVAQDKKRVESLRRKAKRRDMPVF